MSGSVIIVASLCLCIISTINSQYSKINTYNNEILQQKEAINKISLICENLFISNILNHIDNYNISYKYIIISIIIIAIDILLILISLHIHFMINNSNYYNIQIALISVILIIILYFNHKYINRNEEEINSLFFNKFILLSFL
jgi:hypothetical protein